MDVILKFIYLAFCAQSLKKDMTLGNGLCDRTLRWKVMGMVVQINQLLVTLTLFISFQRTITVKRRAVYLLSCYSPFLFVLRPVSTDVTGFLIHNLMFLFHSFAA
jgi:hypothetical protein